MPSYAKFLKGILSKKRRLEDYETVALTKECSAILQNKLPLKLKDPGSFSIPCLIENMKTDKALYDLSASDVQIPIILGRPFLTTAGAIIDVKNGRFKVGDEEMEFNLFRAVKHKLGLDECLRVDITNKLVKEELHKTHPEDPLEVCIVHSHTTDNENTKITACAQSLEVSPSLPLTQSHQVEKLKEEQPKSMLQEDTK
ncbi:uncharacterized protein LOC131171241 [Hevea brasiliensis]|uniref:uncharacterized protein LOC131171241 n=1 Tax=Hevea brasiliensis TaxID=3981 RepID=UPI0025E83B9A|nr:uncharacterized protein LOC131171241 [Hevea brasiliensis]